MREQLLNDTLNSVDGVAYAPHRAVDVREWDVDYYVFSWYKVFGPHMALLYTNSRTFPLLTNINHHFLAARPYIMEPGNVNYEGVSSIPAIFRHVQWLSSADRAPVFSGTSELSRPALVRAFDLIAEHESELCRVLLSYLLSKSRHYTLLGPGSHTVSDRVATVSFTVRGRSSREFVESLEANLTARRRGVGIRWGCFNAYEFCKSWFGEEGMWDGVVRVSFAHYNTLEEAEYVVSAIDETLMKGAAVASKL
ncbi:MAG: pyridoxal phosphate-dependent transferase [Olpidium bornovanus]|uniref:Pyridoxal phosphate-dependent transferase n=1 Tax=Olpidium bornovanus TaxID=278681 RepID=A0A8H8DFG0_9FUNG|nr:MAG: pyridoxal phosphate-dependent transferase [Olpidium bornovanus]